MPWRCTLSQAGIMEQGRMWGGPTAIFASSMDVIPVGPQIWFMYPDVSITKTKSMVRDYRPFSPHPPSPSLPLALQALQEVAVNFHLHFSRSDWQIIQARQPHYLVGSIVVCRSMGAPVSLLSPLPLLLVFPPHRQPTTRYITLTMCLKTHKPFSSLT